MNKSTRRKYSLDESYFDRIDTEKRAYFLGLMFADGCNCEHTNNIMISLVKRDGYLLTEFNKELRSNRPLYPYQPKRKDGYKRQKQLTLNAYSKRLSKNLAKLGCMHIKTLKLKFPTNKQVPTNLVKHFIRGYFDGDGTVGIYKRKNTKWYDVCSQILSTHSFLNKLQKVLKNQADIECSIYHNKKCNPLIGYLNFNGYKKTIKFLDWLYEDATVYMVRKHKKYLEIRNRYKDKLKRKDI